MLPGPKSDPAQAEGVSRELASNYQINPAAV